MRVLLLLPLLVGAHSPSTANVWAVGGHCDLLRESAALHCASALVGHAAPSHFRLLPPLSNASETCRTWQHYQLCTAGVHPRCRAPPTIPDGREDDGSYQCRLMQGILDCVSISGNYSDVARIYSDIFKKLADTNNILSCDLEPKDEKKRGRPPRESPKSEERGSAEEEKLEECDAEGNCTCRVAGFIYDKQTRRCVDVDECLDGSAGCSQTCTNVPGSFWCACDPLFYQLADDKKTCTRRDQQPLWVFFAHGQSIWNISIDGKTFQLQRAGLQKTAMIDLDVQERRLYYADIGAKVIERMNVEGTFPQTIQHFEVDNVEGIAVDWVGRNLYTVRASNILVQSLEGRYRSLLYKDVLAQPRALALHPNKGLAFVTDWSSSAFIASAALDGSSFQKILTDRVVWPNALTVDIHAEKIYWADAFLDVIECANLDGSGRRVVVGDAGSVPHVFGMAVSDDTIFWTDWTYRGLLRANKRNGENITVLAQTALLPYSIKIFHPSLQPPGKSGCETAGCSQLCLVSNNGTGHVCRCGEGFRLGEDGRSCHAACPPDTIQCGGKDPKCISKLFYCDSVAQCSTHEDEENCPPRICLPGQFQCHDNKKCLAPGGLCNKVAECEDSSDEKYC